MSEQEIRSAIEALQKMLPVEQVATSVEHGTETSEDVDGYQGGTSSTDTNAEEDTTTDTTDENIEPQTNGKLTDDVTPKVDATFEQSTNAQEVNGVEQMLGANLDQRFATMQKELTETRIELDKVKVVLSEILTRIELVQEVTDRVTTVDHDSLLSESIKLLV